MKFYRVQRENELNNFSFLLWFSGGQIHTSPPLGPKNSCPSRLSNQHPHPHHLINLKVCSALYVLIQHDQVHLPALQLSNYSFFCFIRRSIILDRQQQHQHHFPPRVPIVAANYHPATAPWTDQHQI